MGLFSIFLIRSAKRHAVWLWRGLPDDAAAMDDAMARSHGLHLAVAYQMAGLRNSEQPAIWAPFVLVGNGIL